MKKLLNLPKNIFFWSYDRGTWQYDFLVILIIATIFFVPGQYFGERDRPLRTLNNEIVRRWSIEPSKISNFAAERGKAERLKNDPKEVVQNYLQEVIGSNIKVDDCIVETDNRGRVTGYSVWFQ